MPKYKAINLSDAITNRYERLGLLCWKIFDQSEDGKELMELLKEEYLLKPVIREGYRKAYGEHYIGIREGQNELIRDLHNRAVNFERIKEEYNKGK